ncbi:AraC family transcriptional regulator [Metabacillus sp. Hm71]|uniref:AraC family transcriptional regulator n=1 Tax=Metabacillus sp. Hm71 TaxID=3450743 RepID=UPI003F4326A2
MRYEEKKPPVELDPYIKCFWYLDREYSEYDQGEVLWPDGCYEIIFHFGSRYKIHNQSMDTSFLIGSLTHYHRLTANGNIRLFGVRLKPWGLKFLLDADLKELRDKFVPLSTLFNKSKIETIENELRDLELGEGMNLLQEFLLESFNQGHDLDKEFIQILTELYESPVQRNIQTFVSMSNYSQRQFERKVIELTGLTPKKLSKVARFNQVRLKMFFNPAIDLYDCMEEFGYYDYAHFSKDFKECIGLTPNEYKNWMLEKRSRGQNAQKNVVFLQDE